MRDYNKLTEQDKKKIIDTFYEGMEMRDMPEALDISSRGIARVLKEANINTKRRNRYSLNESYFSSIDTEDKAYILGMLYADGYVGDEKFNNIVLSLKKDDRDLIFDIASKIGYTGEVRYEEKETNYGMAKRYILNFSSKEMAKDLRNLGLYPGKSSTMTSIPNIPSHLIRHFVRGYFDGDGSVCGGVSTSTHIVGGKVKVYKYNSVKVDIVATIAFGEELIKHISKGFTIKEIDSDNMCYVTTSGREIATNFMEYMYNDCAIYMERKFKKYSEIIGALDWEQSS